MADYRRRVQVMNTIHDLNHSLKVLIRVAERRPLTEHETAEVLSIRTRMAKARAKLEAASK